jgi:hypothetical protein
MTDPPPQPESHRSPPPAAIVALAGWIVPGLGYFMLGHRARAMTVGVTIVLLFAGGLLIGGVRVVDAPDFTSGAASQLPGRVLQKPWFIGQAMAGPIGLAAAYASQAAAASPELRDVVSHARVWEIGTLYTAVAGMLNLLAIIDAAHRAAKGAAE